ncbi:MAG: MoaD/ThiS family protein [candidate division NC10 bacterium]|nr:MoaD/ThiS family protein [candidate division NC10 bacterium]
MKIELRLFATLRRYLPPGSERGKVLLDLQDGLTVEGLIERLGIPPELAELTVVNGRTLERDLKEKLRDGDVVSIFPPIAGG